MYFQGKVWKEGGFWLAEVPLLDAMTQGKTRKQVLEMVADMTESLVNREGFKASVERTKDNEFTLTANETLPLIMLALERRRAAAGLTARQAAEKLGETSPNAYSRYEHGKRAPSILKLAELLSAAAGTDLVLGMRERG